MPTAPSTSARSGWSQDPAGGTKTFDLTYRLLQNADEVKKQAALAARGGEDQGRSMGHPSCSEQPQVKLP